MEFPSSKSLKLSDHKKKKQYTSSEFHCLSENEGTMNINDKIPEDNDLFFKKLHWTLKQQQHVPLNEWSSISHRHETGNETNLRVAEGKLGEKINLKEEDNLVSFEPDEREDYHSRKKKMESKLLEMTPKAKKKRVISFVSFFSMVGRIIGFAKRVKEKAFFRNFFNLKGLQLALIGDKAHFASNSYENQAKDRRRKRRFSIVQDAKRKVKKVEKHTVLNKLRKGVTKIKLFHPLNKQLFLWKLLICFLVLLEIFKITVKLLIDQAWDEGYEFVAPMEILLKVLLLCDIIVVSNTGIFKSGMAIFNRRRVLRNYLRGKLIFDVMALIVLFLPLYKGGENSVEHIPAFQVSSWNTIKICFFFKLREFADVYKFLEEMSYNNESYEGMLSLFKLLLHIVMISHIIACLWFYAAFYQKRKGAQSWLDVSFYQETQSPVEWNKAYLYSWYWSLATMITVGYGDISPRNEIEVVVASLSMIFGCGFFAYAINSIGSIVEGFNVKNQNLKKVLRVINKYMNRKFVDFDLQVRVRKYLEHLWLVEEIENKEFEAKIIENLSKSLKEELLIQSQGRALAKFPLFTSSFSSEVLEKASQIVETISFAPEDPILFEGDVSNNLIYFIIQGEVEIYHQTPNRGVLHLNYLNQGDCFGQLSFFTEQDRDFSARSVGFCTLITIDREAFLNILKNHPIDFENFHFIKDKIKLYGMVSNLGLACESCKRDDHLLKNCPFLKYLPRKDIIIRKHIHWEQNSRTPGFVRKQGKKSESALLFKGKHATDSIIDSDSREEEEDEGDSQFESKVFSEKTFSKKLERRKSIYINDRTDQAEIEMFFQKELEETSSLKPKNDAAAGDDKNVKFARGERLRRNEVGSLEDFEEPGHQQKNKLDDHEQGSNAVRSRKERVARIFTKGSTTGTLERREKANSSVFERNTTVTDAGMFFRRDIALIFGGLNVDKIRDYAIYFPYNNSNFVIEFQKKNRRKSLKKKFRSKSDRLNTERPSINNGALGLIEFRNQQRFFMINKNTVTAKTKVVGKKLVRNSKSVFSELLKV